MNTKEFKIESSFEGLDEAVDVLESFCKTCKCSTDLTDKVMLLGSELITNGIEHGNKLDKSKEVAVTLSEIDKGIRMSVKDEGEGFELETVPDPLQAENILKTGGRGIFLIKELADHFEISENGTRVTADCYR